MWVALHEFRRDFRDRATNQTQHEQPEAEKNVARVSAHRTIVLGDLRHLRQHRTEKRPSRNRNHQSRPPGRCSRLGKGENVERSGTVSPACREGCLGGSQNCRQKRHQRNEYHTHGRLISVVREGHDRTWHRSACARAPEPSRGEGRDSRRGEDRSRMPVRWTRWLLLDTPRHGSRNRAEQETKNDLPSR